MKPLFVGALSVGALLSIDILAPPAPTRRRRKSVAGFEVDEVDEPEPPGIVYDNSPPCPGKILNPEEEGGACVNPQLLKPLPRTSRLMGPSSEAIWPIRTHQEKKVRVSYQDVREKWHGKWGRHFGASRKGDDGTKRYHAGVDLFAAEGDVVQAMEPGEILGILPFHRGTYAVYVLNDSGTVVNYGEVEPDSWIDFGVRGGVGTGQRVEMGQPIARVGKMRKSSMLHVEQYRGDTTMEEIRQGRLRWLVDREAPEKLYDPTEYLLAAQNNWFLQHQTKA